MALSLRAPPGAVPHHVGRRAPRSGVLPALGLTALAPRAKQWLRIARGAAKGVLRPGWAADGVRDGSQIGPVCFQQVGAPTAKGDVLLYLPDLDFMADSLPRSQYPSLVAAGFELWTCSLPAGELRTGFAELSACVEAFALGAGEVTLLGDGFGALLALHVAFRMQRRLKGLVLVEPRLDALLPPSELLGFTPKVLAQLLGVRGLRAAAQKGVVEKRRRSWLRDGAEAVRCELRRPKEKISLPATLLLGQCDLEKSLESRCVAETFEVKPLEGREALVGGQLDMVELLRESCIFRKRKDLVRDFAFPSLKALEEGSGDVERLASLVSPVFCSTLESGRGFGLQGVPVPSELQGRPVLLVGNHQLAGADLGPLVREVLVEKGVLARGLAYPGAMRRGGAPQFERFGAVPVSPRNIFKLLQQGEMVLLFPGGVREALHGPGEEYQLFWPSKTDFVRVAARFDAVVVPFGGVGADDNAQVLASLGDLRRQAEGLLPFMARSEKRRGGLMPVSESLENGLGFPLIAPQLLPATQKSAGFGDRFYFSFGKPVDLKDVDPKDREACAEAYGEIREAVEKELEWLLLARQEDPYRDFARRQVYERVAALEGAQKRIPAGPLKGELVKSYAPRAPSFEIDQLPVSGSA